jgi:hypothetical protein
MLLAVRELAGFIEPFRLRNVTIAERDFMRRLRGPSTDEPFSTIRMRDCCRALLIFKLLPTSSRVGIGVVMYAKRPMAIS